MRKDKKAAECLKLYDEGKTLEEIGKIYGCSKENVRQLLSSREGYNPRKEREGKAEFKATILECKRLLGWTNQVFAEKMGVPINTANKWLHGVYMPKDDRKDEVLKILRDAIESKGLEN